MTTAAPTATSPGVQPLPTLLALARADARRFARHPLFLAGVALFGVVFVWALPEFAADPLVVTIIEAFFLGVFGFVVAHRLTTSLGRSGDLAETSPVGQRRRTAALCLACLVPAFVATLVTLFVLVAGLVWPEWGVPTRPATWFRDEPDLAVLAALIALGPVAALGGPLLGVAVARWAPFRGSALLGMILLTIGTQLPSESLSPWRALAPWIIPSTEEVVDGTIVSTSLVVDVSLPWYLGYVLCLCGLAVVAALLRDPVNRRPVVWAGVVLGLAAIGCFGLTVR